MSPAKILQFQTKAEREAQPTLEDVLTLHLDGNRTLARELIATSNDEELGDIIAILKEKQSHDPSSSS